MKAMAQTRKKSASVVYRAGDKNGPSFDFDHKIKLDQVWLVKDPRLYFPLNQDILKSIRGQKGESLENFYLWKTEIINLEKDFILKETEFDGVYQVELKGSVNAEHTDKIEEIQEIRGRLKTVAWQKTAVPQCKGGLSLMDLSSLVQAVIMYMKDHFPPNPEELNFHAELKAASHWCWSDDYHQLVMKKVPYNDCRLKIAATKALDTWKKEEKDLLKKTEAKKMDKGNDSSDESEEEQLSDIREAIGDLRKYIDLGGMLRKNGFVKRKVSEQEKIERDEPALKP
ncbi:uncharacterized protein LOC122958087 [Acropora millepora]|uniref:uncharacterized protein LOC122958087 n=1 Tax=Acropora millepora TaxID=45264 RepID=UPI001CF21E5D|nr:uncharacterized protein LOC122958087 [Acropora millepora]